MARELFVYWKVARGQAGAAHAAAVDLLQALRITHPALEVRLMRRADEADKADEGDKAGKASEMATFMETYSARPVGVTPAMQAAIEAQAHLAFATLGHPARHVEVFESLDV